MSKTHDYSRPTWGHDVVIHDVHDGGRGLGVSGWGHGVSQHDYIVLPNGQKTTRYLVWEVDYYNDPRDMWSATLVFSPRQAGGEA